MLTDFNLREKVLSISTDNAANMIKCVENLHEYKGIMHIRCGAHVINIAVSKILEILKPKTEKLRLIVKKVCLTNLIFDICYIIRDL